MSPPAECHVLKLPVENIQLIFAASPKPRALDLHNLRLVCKAFDAAVFDDWARIWALYNEQENFHEAHQLQMYDDYRLPAPGALEDIFANLESSCKLNLNLKVICSQMGGTTKVEDDRQQIVDTIVGTHFPGLRELTLYNTEVSSDLLLGTLRRSSDSLEEIILNAATLDMDSGDGEDSDVSWENQRLAALLQTLLDCTNLQYLKLEWLMASESDLLFFELDGSRDERIELHDGKDIAAFLKLNIEHANEIFVREE
ncbi:unnamed protein product [Zymoseptoria tritici ST99CH_3D7]|uniref:F-box domain-containing protein n=1 Tax=Zymoseptoria tritici (strain ST99CH_3D7) TaxID=1276538 RepID=A0A1X7RMS4_ZYMT9|nr:unnamed protein product [Zymoseptoria tritici ST99CH_3D7]